jgi:hypothetical protein
MEDMMDPITKIRIKELHRKITGNMEMAARFDHNPALQEKFLMQAIEATAKLDKLNG